MSDETHYPVFDMAFFFFFINNSWRFKAKVGNVLW